MVPANPLGSRLAAPTCPCRCSWNNHHESNTWGHLGIRTGQILLSIYATLAELVSQYSHPITPEALRSALRTEEHHAHPLITNPHYYQRWMPRCFFEKRCIKHLRGRRRKAPVLNALLDVLEVVFKGEFDPRWIAVLQETAFYEAESLEFEDLLPEDWPNVQIWGDIVGKLRELKEEDEIRGGVGECLSYLGIKGDVWEDLGDVWEDALEGEEGAGTSFGLGGKWEDIYAYNNVPYVDDLQELEKIVKIVAPWVEMERCGGYGRRLAWEKEREREIEYRLYKMECETNEEYEYEEEEFEEKGCEEDGYEEER